MSRRLTPEEIEQLMTAYRAKGERELNRLKFQLTEKYSELTGNERVAMAGQLRSAPMP
jgi:hypothetical protein